ncbi:MAG: excinuclease ABC subunit UvrC [Clostridiaceae bacterium]|nr:excinuclease ABC subunit UvrC [Clostridiaceae bacterium]
MAKEKTQSNRFYPQLDLIPEEPGVYLMRDAAGSVLYVCKANSLRQRLRNYFTANPAVDRRIASMIAKIASYDTIICANELEALVLEATLIKRHKPPYNILMRDDKEYPYIRVTLQEDFPRVMKAFRVGEDVEEGARYYGPWLAGDINRALRVLEAVFPLRNCNRDLPRDIGKERPCLNYHIGRCLAPCAGLISKEDYRKIVDEVLAFLDGRTDQLIKDFQAQMSQAADRLDFEEAARMRGKWQALSRLREGQRVVDQKGGERDALGLARNGRELAIAKLEIRDGRVTGCVHVFAQDLGGEAGDYLASFIREQYRSQGQIPREILLPDQVDDRALLTSYLRQIRGFAVDLLLPQRGQKKALVDMARHNAEKALERRSLSRGSDPRAIEATLQYLGRLTGAKEAPVRIEAYDISHLGQGDRSGAMVVFLQGRPRPSAYRQFTIKGFEGIDDYQSMREVLTRRLARLGEESFGSRPDLILVDGGRGHVSATLALAREAGLPLAGIVKDDRHRTRGLVLADGRILELAPGAMTDQALAEETEEERAERMGLLHLLSSIQDAAHRFALRHNAQRRQKRATRYKLESIKGVGPARRKLLLSAFGSTKKISEASLEDLSALEGLPLQVAEAVYQHFHGQADEEGGQET